MAKTDEASTTAAAINYHPKQKVHPMNDQTQNDRRFSKHFMFSMVVFLLLIAVQTFAIELVPMPAPFVVGLTLLPILPLIWAFFIYRARFRALDEYMQRLTGEAFLWVTGIICFLSFAYGMLAMKFPMPEISFAFILPAVFGGHGLVLQILLAESNREK